MAAAAPTLDQACSLLLQNDPIVFQTATEALFKVIQNILQQPEEPKFRSLRRTAKGFSEKIATAKGAVRFLKAAGFVEEGGGDDAALALPVAANMEPLVNAKAALKAVVKHRLAVDVKAREEARQQENAAAAEKLRELKDISVKNKADQTAEQALERQRLMDGFKDDRDDLVRQKDLTQWR